MLLCTARLVNETVDIDSIVLLFTSANINITVFYSLPSSTMEQEANAVAILYLEKDLTCNNN